MQPGSALLRTLIFGLFWIFDAIQFFVFAWVVVSLLYFVAVQTSFPWRHRSAFRILESLNSLFGRALDPLLRPFRRLLPPSRTGGLDFSPMLFLLLLYLIRTFLVLLVGPILMG
jgi:uncharacterized protein YggT (Ycf19 family)